MLSAKRSLSGLENFSEIFRLTIFIQFRNDSPIETTFNFNFSMMSTKDEQAWLKIQ